MRLQIAIVVTAMFVGGCQLERRVGELEGGLHSADRNIERQARDIQRVRGRMAALQQELDGVSRLRVVVPAGREVAIYGNQSGHNTLVSVLNASGAQGLQIKTQRIPKPSDTGTAPLPEDFEKTNWLDLSARGSRRQLAVPCGFELRAKSPLPASIAVLVKRESAQCQSP
ncbi:hypothetical protein [Bosea sp. (in: a-proteobacteria)]|uniref:hypothetical protein n=1 Tax=Bosea sp. (in: a-proteobacteria) TaxID=1871050 RepID=UPI0009539FA7|nr:hypothetical protein [Bosea sp. (in: a-proteobacteria)]TAJ28755.1 MAG: hypothetical protein EPO59_17490 [Bosea sp. (in: a-proteobacteria)]SIR24770.1 hypothetical protein SAMN05880592_11342 [Bosea sp. TND4EK4]